jgi:ent-kaurene oxidase
MADWTTINVHNMTCRVVAAIGSSVMSGPELSSKQEWTDLLVSYSSDVCHTSIWLKQVPPYFRDFASYMMPSLRRIRQHRLTAHMLVIPVLKAREEASKDPEYIKPNDLMQWIADRSNAEDSLDSLEYQAELQLSNGLATILSSSVACTHALFDLASYPECMESLREEVDSTIASYNGLTPQGLAKMEKLDSFLKESQRHNVANFC